MKEIDEMNIPEDAVFYNWDGDINLMMINYFATKYYQNGIQKRNERIPLFNIKI